MRRLPRNITLITLTALLGAWYWFSLPDPLFNSSYSTVVLDRHGELMGARIARDEQWRFPPQDSLPEKMQVALIHKEDRYFHWHPGFNPVSLLRAAWLNLKHGEVISGGSTITMQLVRLSKSNPPRTVWEKLKEIILATRIELSYNKDEILALYAAHAPFGGNVVGYEAAAWRYFNRSPHELSWAECATLAVLPNAPGMIHPGRNRSALARKREELLQKLYDHGVLDEPSYRLALLEEIPAHPHPLPDLASHLTNNIHLYQSGSRTQTTLDPHWQEAAKKSLNRHMQRLAANHIKNGALLLIDNSDGSVRAYIGNASYRDEVDEGYNDMLQTPRSPGSILKPFLYASMFDSGELLPQALLKDVPVFLGGFKPENFEQSYDGAVPAGEALSRSLNIPAVLLLREYSPERFLKRLHQLGFGHMNRVADHYGLSLILGGAEVTPWELGRAYYRLAASLNSYNVSGSVMNPAMADLHFAETATEFPSPPIGKAAIYETFDILTTVNRPDSEMGWQKFGGGNIAWKTGTSFGFRDAWAVGITPRYTCVVWVGNADGEGRPGLIGAEAAGPLLFDMMKQLSSERWFTQPLNDMIELKICQRSGLIASAICPATELKMLPLASQSGGICTYHRKIFVDAEGYRVSRACAMESEMTAAASFVLPAVQAWYYSRQHADYRGVPSWRPGCGEEDRPMLEVIYPQSGGEIFLPREIGGDRGSIIMEVAHQSPDETVYWHLNGEYIGSTQTFHQQAMHLAAGSYRLHIEDSQGNSAHRSFRVLAGS